MPKHIWEGPGPVDVQELRPEKGFRSAPAPTNWPAYQPDRSSLWTRDDNWWGAKTGFIKLPEPETHHLDVGRPAETRAALMANGQLDSLMDITLGALQALQAQNPNVVTWFTEPAVRLGARPLLTHL